MGHKLSVFLVFLILTSGCLCCTTPENDVGVKGEINAGTSVEAASGSVGSSGGSVIVEKSGGPMDGFRIDVPQGALKDANVVEVSYAPVEGHSFGEYFNPVSPLITVKGLEGYSEKPLKIKIPVEVPDGFFAMAFYYDPAKGTLEGIPLASVEKGSITIATRHFSDIVVSMINQTTLNERLQAGIDTGFQPGVDDWEFENKGSYIAPGGHCAGQSISAMWYYAEKKLKGSPGLYNLYDNNGDPNPRTPSLGEDDSLAYKFASTVQSGINWDSDERTLFFELSELGDTYTWNAFAYSMLLTGEPQYMGIKGWDDTEKSFVGHAIIAYRMTKDGIYVSDPNYPGPKSADRVVRWGEEGFSPYSSGSNAQDISQNGAIPFDQIRYFGKTALIPWPVIESLWDDFERKTIGNGKFPECRITAIKGGAEEEVTDGWATQDSVVNITASCSDPLGGVEGVALKAFRSNKGEIEPASLGGYNYVLVRDYDKNEIIPAELQLNPGSNLVGFYIEAKPKREGETTSYAWTDFQWIDVDYKSTPNLTIRAVKTGDTTYAFTAEEANLPEDAAYTWFFDDGSSAVEGKDQNTVEHEFPKRDRDYDITLHLSSPGTFESASLNLSVRPNLIDILHQMNYIDIDFTGRNTFKKYENGNFVSERTEMAGFGFSVSDMSGSRCGCFKNKFHPIVWDGTSFETSFTDICDDDLYDMTIDIKGTVSPDGRRLESLTATEHGIDPRHTGVIYEYSTSMEITQIDATLGGHENEVYYYKHGTDVKNSMKKIEDVSKVLIKPKTPQNPDKTEEYTTTNWDETSSINIKFYEKLMCSGYTET